MSIIANSFGKDGQPCPWIPPEVVYVDACATAWGNKCNLSSKTSSKCLALAQVVNTINCMKENDNRIIFVVHVQLVTKECRSPATRSAKPPDIIECDGRK